MTCTPSAPTAKNPKPKSGGGYRPSNDCNGNHDIADMAETYGIMASDPVWTGRKQDRRRDSQK